VFLLDNYHTHTNTKHKHTNKIAESVGWRRGVGLKGVLTPSVL